MHACVRVGGTETGARELGGHLALQLAGPQLGTTGPSLDPDSMAAAGHQPCRAAAGAPCSRVGLSATPLPRRLAVRWSDGSAGLLGVGEMRLCL